MRNNTSFDNIKKNVSRTYDINPNEKVILKFFNDKFQKF